MDFLSKLKGAIARNNTLLCVGMDPTEAMLTAGADLYSRLMDWGKSLIDQTVDLVCCYKPNAGFFEQFGPKGVRAMADIIAAVPEDIPVLLDAKRGDIGSTAVAYARGAWEGFAADAVTLSPYLGQDSIKPFLDNPEKAVFVLCQTSNPSAQELQQHGTPPLFEAVAQASAAWGEEERVGLVIGATQPEALARVRAIRPGAWFLVPGVGAQGGDLRQALELGLRPDGLGLILPVSRGILQAADPRQAAAELRDAINVIRAEVVAKAANTPPESQHAYQTLIRRLFDCGSVKFGQFTLASGKTSPVYLDLRRLVSYPDVMDLAVEAYVDAMVGLEYDLIGAVPYAALPIASIAAAKLKQPMIYTRKEVKTHGTGQQIEGVWQPGQRVVLVEDVITSGGSILTAAAQLREAGLQVTDAVLLVDREQGGVCSLAEQGIAVHAVLRFSEVLEELFASARIDEATYKSVKEYLGQN